MIFLIILITLSFYLKYFNTKQKNSTENIILEKVDDNQNNSSTYIDNIDYVSSDASGNKYQITAEQAEIKVENSNVMFLKKVTAYIFVKDSDVVKITSDFGKYNSKNYDTIFSQNVIVNYPRHKITGEYLDFSFLTDLGVFTTNVIYTGEKTKLFADKMEMNLTTKDTKIFMEQPVPLYDDDGGNIEYEKVLVVGTE